MNYARSSQMQFTVDSKCIKVLTVNCLLLTSLSVSTVYCINTIAAVEIYHPNRCQPLDDERLRLFARAVCLTILFENLVRAVGGVVKLRLNVGRVAGHQRADGFVQRDVGIGDAGH